MKLTEEQKGKVRKAVAELAAANLTDEWGEPMKDVESSRHWPQAARNASDDEIEDLDNACFDYLNAAVRSVVAQIKKLA